MDCARQCYSQGKAATVQALEVAAAVRRRPPADALALAEAGDQPFAPLSVSACARYALPATIAALQGWALALPYPDARACFAALFEGSGSRLGSGEGRLVRVRYLTGAHGLRPIRVRLVAYLVAPRAVRAIAAEVTAALPSAAAFPDAEGGVHGASSV